MRCCVQNCKNDTRKMNEVNGITFHAFPKEQNKRKIWIEALGIDNWEPKQRSAICSEHFPENAFFETKRGLKKILCGAVPMRAIESTEELKASATLKVCRICLAIDVKMYHIADFKLAQLYMEVTGIALKPKDRMPKMLCWECVARLRAAKRLRDRAAACYNLLTTKFKKGNYMTIEDVRRIKRGRHNLQSTLVMKCFDNDDCDLVIKQEQEPPDEEEFDREESDKEELDLEESDKKERDLEELDKEVLDLEESDKEVLNLEESDKEELDWEESDKEELDWEELDKEELHLEESEPEQEKPEVKEDNIFAEDPPGGVLKSDDDSPLSKFSKKRARTRKGNVKPDKGVSVAEEDNPTSTIDRYKVSSVRRRKTHDALDGNQFTVCTLTYDEQIAEIQQRAESSGYRLARYKCTVCYRGFHIQHKYDAHVVRHSEQYGAYECSICKSRLKTANALRKHITALHTKKYSCKDCPFETKSRGMAREHERWHAGTKYQCPHCPSEFDKLTTYLGHIRIKHVSNFVCELCGYTFISQKGIVLHKKLKHRLADKTLSLDGPYCAECDVRFVSKEAHARHLKLSSQHSSDDDPNRLRNDSQCLKTERNGLVMRRREVSFMEADPARAVTCEQCGIKLRNQRVYAQHFWRVHPDKNRTKFSSMKSPCMCEQCGQIFRSNSLLLDHMGVHTNAGAGEKRFKCDLCDKSFTHKTNLVTHKHLHSGSRPSYECPVCGKHFALFKNRRRHMFTHTGLRPFKCNTCSKCFKTATEQRLHVDHIHLKKPWPKRARTRAHPGRED